MSDVTWVKTADLPRQPRWSPEQAVAYGRGQIADEDKNYGGMCDHFVAWCYGYAGSGYADAITHWQNIPFKFRHRDRQPPRGALPFWRGGSSGHGHVAVSLGNGYILTNDINSYGQIDRVPLGDIESRWGLEYLGWAEPYLLASWGTNPNPAPNVTSSRTRAAIQRINQWLAAATHKAGLLRDQLAGLVRNIRRHRANRDDIKKG